MSADERFVRLSHFLQHVLPGLARGSALTHLVGTYHWVGTRPPIMPTEITIDDELTQILLHGLTPTRIVGELPELLRNHVDSESPLLATLYAGRSGFLDTLTVVELVMRAHPSAQLVIAACGCVTEDQEFVLRRGMECGVISHVVWVECGGSKAMGLIRDAVADSRLGPAIHAVQPTADSPSLGA